MRVYKPTRKGPRGATIPYKLWYIELRDHRGIIRRLSAFTDRVASDELGRKLERLAALRATGEPPDRELARAIEGWPARLREKLERIGMLDAHAAARAGAIEVHVEAFVASLDARERTAQHVARTGSRLRAVLGGIGAHKWGELSAEAVERHMRGLREGGLSARAVNLYLQAVRQFARWMVRTGRAVEDPLRTLTPLNVRADRRRVRRALGVEELRALLYATAGEPERFGLDDYHSGLGITELSERIIADISENLRLFEPRLELRGANLMPSSSGARMCFDLDCWLVTTQRPLRLSLEATKGEGLKLLDKDP